MIPIRDSIPSRTVPVVNYAIIAANGAAFLFELTLGRDLGPFLKAYGLVPKALAAGGEPLGVLALPFATAMFLHGGWMHLISNMWSLYIFGDNVEDRLGHAAYLAFYLLSGLAASLLQVWASWGSSLPVIGASGAIAGVMGAYFLLFPGARVVALVPIVFFLRLVEMPAYLFLGLWLFFQFYSGTIAVLGGAGRFGGVAWWAHVGGFLGGMLLLKAFAPRKARAS